MSRIRKAGDTHANLTAGNSKSGGEATRSIDFGNLYGLLNDENLTWCWEFVRKDAAPGVDKVNYHGYQRTLGFQYPDLVGRLKDQSISCASWLGDSYIPKLNGKIRPLGIPTTEDKLLQLAVAKILEAIYEQDFLGESRISPPTPSAGCSSDADPFAALWEVLLGGRSGHQRIFRQYRSRLDDADARRRIDDRPFLHLIRKWLKAGILETDGQVVHPVTGTPQGGVVSPVLANMYLHYALDLWFERRFNPTCQGAP